MCFSMMWVAEFFILCIVVGACVAIFNLLWPRIVAAMGSLGTWADLVLRVVKIIVIALILIWIVWFVFDAISCLLSGSGVGVPHLLPRR
jgi:hypothetical protein